MAICITFGTHEFTSRLQGFEQVRAHCQNCGNWDAHCETRWPFFTVCFIRAVVDMNAPAMQKPVIPLSTHKYKEVRCYRCGFTQDLSIRPDINPGTQPPPGVPWGPAYVPPQQYQSPQSPPPVASGGNLNTGHVYK